MVPRSVKPLDYFLYGFRGPQVPAPSTATAGQAIFDDGGTYVLDNVVGSAFGFPALGFRSGQWFSTPFVEANITDSHGAGILNAMPIWIPRDLTIDKIGCWVVTGNAGTVARIGIYNDNGQGFPGTVLLDAGTFSGTTAGAKEIDINQAVSKGLYWLGFLGEVGPINVSGWTGTTGLVSDADLADLVVGDGGSCYRKSAVAAGALPTPFPADAIPSSTAVQPRVWIKA